MCPISAVMPHVQIVCADVNSPLFSQLADTESKAAKTEQLVCVCNQDYLFNFYLGTKKSVSSPVNQTCGNSTQQYSSLWVLCIWPYWEFYKCFAIVNHLQSEHKANPINSSTDARSHNCTATCSDYMHINISSQCCRCIKGNDMNCFQKNLSTVEHRKPLSTGNAIYLTGSGVTLMKALKISTTTKKDDWM